MKRFFVVLSLFALALTWTASAQNVYGEMKLVYDQGYVFAESSMPDGGTAWFDELLDTQMSICRGSGVLQRHADVWSIRQYVLSMTIPNALADSVIALKSPIEAALLK